MAKLTADSSTRSNSRGNAWSAVAATAPAEAVATAVCSLRAKPEVEVVERASSEGEVAAAAACLAFAAASRAPARAGEAPSSEFAPPVCHAETSTHEEKQRREHVSVGGSPTLRSAQGEEGAFGSRRTHRHRECCQKMQASDRGERGLRDTAWAQAAHERRKCAWVCVCAHALSRVGRRRGEREEKGRAECASHRAIASRHRIARRGGGARRRSAREGAWRARGRTTAHAPAEKATAMLSAGGEPALHPCRTANRHKFTIV